MWDEYPCTTPPCRAHSAPPSPERDASGCNRLGEHPIRLSVTARRSKHQINYDFTIQPRLLHGLSQALLLLTGQYLVEDV